MTTNTILDVAMVERVRALLRCMDEGNEQMAVTLMSDLVKCHEANLFQEVGKLTRQLHNTMHDFEFDDRVTVLAQSEIPDARARLNYVIAMTEQAANRVLAAVEESVPLAEGLNGRARALREKWARFRQIGVAKEEFHAMATEIDLFLVAAEEHATRLHGNLSEVLLAQDFQDITGQIIRRVITLVQEIEVHLVGLLGITGQRAPARHEGATGKNSAAAGPAVPGLDTVEDRLQGQDDVDDLLSSLGF